MYKYIKKTCLKLRKTKQYWKKKSYLYTMYNKLQEKQNI